MWNELNHERMQLFKKGKLTAETKRETYKKYYERYKHLVGSATAQQIANMNSEAWASFFAMLKTMKEGRLPPFIKKISPPGYWKDRVLGKRVKMVVARSDRYVIEPVNAGAGYMVLRDYGLRIKYAGKLRWAGRQGRMIIVRETGRWFAYILVEDGARPSKSSPRGYIKGEPERIKQREPRGNEVAFIDMGLNNLFAIVTTTGDAALIKGGAVKAEHYREKTEIRAMQETRDKLRNMGL